jgi:hypothetical protein
VKFSRIAREIHAPNRPWAHLDTTTGTPDLSGSNTRRLHTCRMNPAFHADAASCIGGSVRGASANNSQFPLASGSFIAKVVLQFHPLTAAVFSFQPEQPLTRENFQRHSE